jgi:fumarate hydratase class II
LGREGYPSRQQGSGAPERPREHGAVVERLVPLGGVYRLALGGAGGYLEMNVYKPLLKRIGEFVERSLMLVTALSPVIGYDKASKIAHFALDHDLTLNEAALQLGFVDAAEFDRIVDPRTMVAPHVATA